MSPEGATGTSGYVPRRLVSRRPSGPQVLNQKPRVNPGLRSSAPSGQVSSGLGELRSTPNKPTSPDRAVSFALRNIQNPSPRTSCLAAVELSLGTNNSPSKRPRRFRGDGNHTSSNHHLTQNLIACVSCQPRATHPKESPVERTMLISAASHLPLVIRIYVCRLNDEKVVNPPQSPTISNC
jgi:hypothetical protein